MDIDEHDILMKIPDVDIQISKEVKYKGYFMLICSDEEDKKSSDKNKKYIFEWRPDPKSIEANSSKDVPQNVSASSNQISEVLKRDISFTQVSLIFILIDSTRLPRLLFNKHPHLHVQHMMDILINENLVIMNPDRPNAFKFDQRSSKTEVDIFGYKPTSSLPTSYAVDITEHNEILKKLNYQPLAADIPPLTIEDLNKIIGGEFFPPSANKIEITNFDQIKTQIFHKGISPEARPYVWPILFGSIPITSDKAVIDKHLEKNLAEFRRIKSKILLYTKFQIAHSAELRDIQRIVFFDVMRNDRNLEAFKDKSPNLGLLETVLTCYALYNRDLGYCQGMTDIITPLVLTFIKGWTEPVSEHKDKSENGSNNSKNDTENSNSKSENENNNSKNDTENNSKSENENNNSKSDAENNSKSENENNTANESNADIFSFNGSEENIIINSDGEEVSNMAGQDYSNGSKAIFYDGSLKTYEEAESFIFWNFVHMMEITHHERLFSHLDIGKQFLLERTTVIATSVHKPLKSLLGKTELKGLDFLFRPVLLLFKREFKLEELFRLWDSIFASNCPFVFPRFIAAAMLIIVYPKLLIYTNGSLGEVMEVLDGTMEKVEVKAILQIATSLVEKVESPFEKHNFIYEAIPLSQKFRDYVPKYMKFIDK